MHEPQFANKVRHLLNQGTDLRPDTLLRLKLAREHALRHQRVSRPVGGLAWADGVVSDFGGVTGFSFRLLLPMAVLIGGLLAINSWQHNQRVAEVEEIDA